MEKCIIHQNSITSQTGKFILSIMMTSEYFIMWLVFHMSRTLLLIWTINTYFLSELSFPPETDKDEAEYSQKRERTRKMCQYFLLFRFNLEASVNFSCDGPNHSIFQ